jgi:hypothetical protein
VLFNVSGGCGVSRRRHPTIFGIVTDAHAPRQFRIQRGLRAKVMRVAHALTPGIFVLTRVSKPLLNCPMTFEVRGSVPVSPAP